jgi:hypothetical protein
MPQKGDSMPSNQTSKAFLPLVLIAAGGLILAGAAVWLIAGQSTTPVQTQDTAPDEGMTRLTAEQSHTAVQSGEAVILDVRGAQYYDTQHIAGAINIPEDELEARHTELDPELMIITYCT